MVVYELTHNEGDEKGVNVKHSAIGKNLKKSSPIVHLPRPVDPATCCCDSFTSKTNKYHVINFYEKMY